MVALDHTWHHWWHRLDALHTGERWLLRSIHLRVVVEAAQEGAVHMFAVVEVEPHSFASKLDLEVQGVDCNLADFVVPFDEHILVLAAHVRLVPCLSLCLVVPVLVHATPAPFESALFLVLSLFPASLYHNHTDCAFLHTQACRMQFLCEVLAAHQDPPSSQMGSRCA